MKINYQKIRKKKYLYIGLFFLYIAILLKILGNSPLSVCFLVGAVFFKILFAVEYAKKGLYKPGYELVFLVIGLFLFLSGLYSTSLPLFIPSKWWLMAPGLAFKFFFLFILISKIRKASKLIKEKQED